MRIAKPMFLALALVAGCLGLAQAGDIEKIIFESGSVGPSGSPAPSGWQFLSTNTNPDPNANAPEAAIEDNPNRTFVTGTNKEALVLHPWFHKNDVSFGHGAEWNVSNDPAASVETIDPGEIVYLQMEIFSDIAGGGQYFKAGSAIGFKGNGTVPSTNRGFNDLHTSGDNNVNMISDVEADWTWDKNSRFDFNGLILGSDRAQRHYKTRFPDAPTSDDLDISYVSTAIFRQGVDAATPFVGTESEVSEAFDNQNGGESTATGGSVRTNDTWGGNTNVITGLVIDRAQVNLLRGSNDSLGGSVARVDAHSNYVDPADNVDDTSPTFLGNAVVGIKMFRFGITKKTDVNLDGKTDDADKAIVNANLGKWPKPLGETATFFEGDINNDQVVDANDLAFFNAVSPCDLNEDGAVDAADAGIMFGVWGAVVAPTAADKNHDGFVDAADAGEMFAAWTGDPGTPGANAATAEYNFETGELKISSAGAVNVFVQSASGKITPLSPAPAVPIGLLTNNASRVGITNLGPINTTNFSFGSIGKGLAMNDLKLVYTPALGQKGVEIAAGAAGFSYIPEPASVGLLGVGLAGLLLNRRRAA